MNRTPLSDITEDQIRTFEEDGIVLLKGQFDMEWIERLRDLAEADLANPGPKAMELDESGGRFFFDTFMWTFNDGFRTAVFDSPAAEITATMMRSAKTNIIFDQLLIKEPGTSERTIWHHDITYWPVDGHQVATLWLALDEVTPDSGAVEYIKGSHKWGQRYKAEAFAGDGRYKESLPEVPDIEARRDELDIAQFEMAPGDCTVHHGLMVHGAPGNELSDRRRRAYVTRWAGDDVVYYPRPNIQPMIWAPDAAEGGPLDSKLWPVVWRQGA